MSTRNGLVQRLWSYCNILRDDGLVGDYLERVFRGELVPQDPADEPPRPSLPASGQALDS